MFNTRKIQKKWLYSFLAVIIIIILIFMIFNNILISRFQEIAETTYINRTTGFAENLNNELQQLQKIAFQEQLAVQNIQIGNANDMNSDVKLNLYNMSSTLQNIKGTNNLIENIYIYYPKLDYIVGDLGLFKKRNYYYLMNNRYVNNSNNIAEVMDGLPQGYSIEDIYSNNEMQLVYKSFRPYDYENKIDRLPSSVIYITINKDEINNMISYSNVNIGSGFISIVDNNDRIYAASENAYGGIENLDTNKNIYVINQSTDFDSINLIGAIDEKILLEDRNLMNVYSYIMLVICFIISFFMSVYLSRHNTKPLRLLVNRIQAKNTSDQNEYEIIRNSIDEMIEKNKRIIEKNELRLERLHEEFVRNLIGRRINSGLEFNDLLQYYDIDIDYSYYTFLKIAKTNVNTDFKEECTQLIDKEFNGKNIIAQVILHKDNFIIFINHDDKEVIDTLFCYIYENFSIKKSEIKVSETIDHFTGIFSLYKNIDKKIEIGDIKKIKSKGYDISERIKLIIDDNYENPAMGLIVIAEQLNMSTSYISRVFKKQYNIGIAEYISSIRIEKAKKLILLNTMTVKEIAESVGFSSDINFIRVFKKHENITPGKYKMN